jgi:hypothetical protein
MPNKNSALRRRVLPFTPLDLMLEEQGGAFFRVELKLAFDMNAGAAIQERTANPKSEFRGYRITDFIETWSNIAEPQLLKAMLWGSVLAHQPEYNCDEGFETVGTFIQENNAQEIIDAIEAAYFKYLPKNRVDDILKLKAELEAKAKGEPGRPLAKMTPGVPENGGTAAPISWDSAGSNSGPSPVTTLESASANSAS